jgi:hypothetical protein
MKYIIISPVYQYIFPQLVTGCVNINEINDLECSIALPRSCIVESHPNIPVER